MGRTLAQSLDKTSWRNLLQDGHTLWRGLLVQCRWFTSAFLCILYRWSSGGSRQIVYCFRRVIISAYFCYNSAATNEIWRPMRRYSITSGPRNLGHPVHQRNSRFFPYHHWFNVDGMELKVKWLSGPLIWFLFSGHKASGLLCDSPGSSVGWKNRKRLSLKREIS